MNVSNKYDEVLEFCCKGTQPEGYEGPVKNYLRGFESHDGKANFNELELLTYCNLLKTGYEVSTKTVPKILKGKQAVSADAAQQER